MSTNNDRKTCLDCEYYDIMSGNMYGVCIKDSYIDSDDDAYLQWMYADTWACGEFKDFNEMG